MRWPQKWAILILLVLLASLLVWGILNLLNIV